MALERPLGVISECHLMKQSQANGAVQTALWFAGVDHISERRIISFRSWLSWRHIARSPHRGKCPDPPRLSVQRIQKKKCAVRRPYASSVPIILLMMVFGTENLSVLISFACSLQAVNCKFIIIHENMKWPNNSTEHEHWACFCESSKVFQGCFSIDNNHQSAVCNQ